MFYKFVPLIFILNHCKFKANFFKKIGKSYEQFHFIQEGKEGKLYWNTGKKRWDINRPVSKEWWWTSKSGLNFAWIPIEYLP
ncbi:hypothetical protein GMMP15_1420002 [Candidatus Magnetomoraceae bacterium gMMP-15]